MYRGVKEDISDIWRFTEEIRYEEWGKYSITETKETKIQWGPGGHRNNDTRGARRVVNTCQWFPLRNKGIGKGKENTK